MVRITIFKEGTSRNIEVEPGHLLLSLLRLHGEEVYSPCGGNGSCGKCEVEVGHIGLVNACRFRVNQSIEITLPDTRLSTILIDQHKFTRELPLLPGDCLSLSDKPFGMAIDIGTSTCVAYFVNLLTGGIVSTRSFANPQKMYGADVISRIQFASYTDDNLKRLQSILLDSVNEQILSFVRLLKITQKDLVKIVVAGNTTMLHLLMGISPASIGQAPFTPVFLDEKQLKGSASGIKCHEDSMVKILPSIAGFVGSDIVAGLASLSLPTNNNYLFMDIGTNGELALITPDKIWCCSTAAGPAFEGANISCGMSALEGAISVYRNGEYEVIGRVPPQGICGSGLVDLIAYLLMKEKISCDGTLEHDYLIVSEKNSFSRIPLFITQKDVREVQLAKSAIISGIHILLKEAGLTFSQLEAVFLAGGFGNYMDVRNALKIGLLPHEAEGKIITVGNSSGTGALAALKCEKFDEDVKRVISLADHVELSHHEDFPLEFVMNMGFEK